MPLLESFQFALLNSEPPALPRWQEVIHRRDFLFPLDLITVSFSAATPCSARLHGREVGFTCEPRPIKAVVGTAHPELARSWSYAVALRGTGGLASSVAAGMAAQCCALATGGILYDSDNGGFREWDLLRQGVDLVLSTEFGRHDLYDARYPGSHDETPSGPPSISSGLFRG